MRLGTQIPPRHYDSYYQCLGTFADNGEQCKFWSFDKRKADRHERRRRRTAPEQMHGCVSVEIEQGQVPPQVVL